MAEAVEVPTDVESPVKIEAMKPSILFHASANKNIEVLVPKAETIRDRLEGPVVFATSDKAEASKFLVPSDDSWTRKMHFGNVNIHVISDRQRYEDADKGGAIYELSSESFEHDPSKGTWTEWTSKDPVRPAQKEEYESGLQAQLENGVQVYFVNKETFDKINKALDHGYAIIKSLNSENKIKNINIKDF